MLTWFTTDIVWSLLIINIHSFWYWQCEGSKLHATQFVSVLLCVCVSKLDLGTVRDGRGSFVKNRGAHLVSLGWRGATKFVYVCLWIEKQNRMAALTRVLKGCVKAAGWGTRDSMGGGWGWNVHQISIKENKGVASSLLSHTHKWTHAKTSTQTTLNHVKPFVFDSANELMQG